MARGEYFLSSAVRMRLRRARGRLCRSMESAAAAASSLLAPSEVTDVDATTDDDGGKAADTIRICAMVVVVHVDYGLWIMERETLVKLNSTPRIRYEPYLFSATKKV
jgi:hypothetical protein